MSHNTYKHDEIIEILSNSIDKREFAIFCGAGISYNSGLPVVGGYDDASNSFWGLIPSILDALKFNKEEKILFTSKKLPFEGFIESLIHVTQNQIEPILDVFELGDPNLNHYLIAGLLNRGAVDTVVTTNFDRLIEKALGDSEVKVDYLSTADQFDNEDWSIQKPRLIKPHGSIENRSSIGITLQKVADKTLYKSTDKVTQFLFNAKDNMHSKVLILGYSCSDEFDLLPQIRALKENFCEVYYVDHKASAPLIMELTKELSPFENFTKVYKIQGDTDDLIKGIWAKVIPEEIPEIIFNSVPWKNLIKSFGDPIQDHHSWLFKSVLFNKVNEFDLLLKYGEFLLADVGNVEAHLYGFQFIGMANHRKGRFDEAIESYTKGIEYFRLLRPFIPEKLDVIFLINLYENMIRVLNDTKNYSLAKTYSDERDRMLNERTTNSDLVSMDTTLSYSYRSEANTYLAEGQFDKAKSSIEKSYQLTLKNTDLVGQVSCLITIGNIAISEQNYSSAEENFIEGLSLAKKLDELPLIAACNNGLGRIYLNVGCAPFSLEKIGIAEEYFEKSIQGADKFGDKFLLCSASFNSALCNYHRGENSIAKTKLNQCSQYSISNNFKKLNVDIQNLLSSIYRSESSFEEAQECLFVVIEHHSVERDVFSLLDAIYNFGDMINSMTELEDLSFLSLSSVRLVMTVRSTYGLITDSDFNQWKLNKENKINPFRELYQNLGADFPDIDFKFMDTIFIALEK